MDGSGLKLVTNADGSLVMTTEGKILLCNEKNNEQFEAVPNAELLAMFGYMIASGEGNSEKSYDMSSTASESVTGSVGNLYWKGNSDAVRQLIHLWNSHADEFKSTSIKNDDVWKKIASKLEEAKPSWKYNWQQCKDKIKYIKKEYHKTRDWNAVSGNEPKTCAFYAEMEDILGDKPCVKPVSTAASLRKRPSSTSPSRDDNSSSSIESDRLKSSEPEKKKVGKQKRKKRTKVEKEIDSWSEKLRQDADKREKSRAERFERGLQVYQDTMQKLIDKL